MNYKKGETMLKFILRDILDLPQINELLQNGCNNSTIDKVEAYANNYLNQRIYIADHIDLKGTGPLNAGRPENENNRYRLGLWIWDVIKDEVRFGAEYYSIIGYNQGDFPSSIKSWVDMIHPSDREFAVNKLLESIYKRKKYYTNEYRLKTRESTWQPIICKAKMFDTLEDNNSIFMAWLHMNILNASPVNERDKIRMRQDI
jgi:PAS domain-containing protein